MKKLLILTLLAAMLLTVASAIPVMAEEDILTVNKTEFVVGEPILVTAQGSGKDWVGLYLAEDTPSMVPSILWYYVAQDGYSSGETVDIRQAFYVNPDRPHLNNVPAGEYTVTLLANDGYEVLAAINITVKEKDEPAPGDTQLSATYESAKAGAGRADGKLTIKAEGTAPASYELWWAGATGKIKGYSVLDKILSTGAETVYTLTPNTLVPAGADRILIYPSNMGATDLPLTVMLPEGIGTYDLGKLCTELQVMSDIHINADSGHLYNRHFSMALADIAKVSPDSIGLFINGDTADHGLAAEYTAFRNLVERAKGAPPVYVAMGNHDYFGPNMTDAERIAQFLKGTENDSQTPYFDRTVGGVHFIFLAGEKSGDWATLSDAQLKWLDDTLAADKESGKPVFVFLHQGLIDTVAGTFAYQKWHGVHQTQELSAVLQKYPNAILFSGHSHWVLESEMSLKLRDDKLPTILNTASGAYLWDDDCNKTNVGIEGSQGYYIYIYEDCIAFRGRDFVKGEWISSAQFIVNWEGAGNAAEEETTVSAEETTVAEPIDTAEVETPTGEVETPRAEDTNLADTMGSGLAESDTESAKADGCASAVLSGALVALLSAAALCLIRRKDSKI